MAQKKVFPIEIRQTLDATDLFNFSVVSFLRSFFGRAMFVVYVLGILFSAVYFWSLWDADALSASSFWWLLFFTFGFPMLFGGGIWWGAQTSSRQNAARYRDMTYRLTEAGVETEVGGQPRAYAWAAYRNAVETKQHYLLYFAPRQAHILKKEAFSSAAAREAARKLLREKLKMN